MKKDHKLQSYTMHQKVTFFNTNNKTKSWTLMMGSQQGYFHLALMPNSQWENTKSGQARKENKTIKLWWVHVTRLHKLLNLLIIHKCFPNG
jgi:hypothetical protein